ncbi:hypothetical protein [Bradyrhizobium sp. 2TAF24]|uniref:hypothetical protein n=1 Tax=Bradyrhizobium sp. 2TAF24 TaxID=3233011 RepID=UPI003F905BCD
MTDIVNIMPKLGRVTHVQSVASIMQDWHVCRWRCPTPIPAVGTLWLGKRGRCRGGGWVVRCDLVASFEAIEGIDRGHEALAFLKALAGLNFVLFDINNMTPSYDVGDYTAPLGVDMRGHFGPLGRRVTAASCDDAAARGRSSAGGVGWSSCLPDAWDCRKIVISPD